jgi:hypothetical protein
MAHGEVRPAHGIFAKIAEPAQVSPPIWISLLSPVRCERSCKVKVVPLVLTLFHLIAPQLPFRSPLDPGQAAGPFERGHMLLSAKKSWP